jgi:hypothetical protein
MTCLASAMFLASASSAFLHCLSLHLLAFHCAAHVCAQCNQFVQPGPGGLGQKVEWAGERVVMYVLISEL